MITKLESLPYQIFVGKARSVSDEEKKYYNFDNRGTGEATPTTSARSRTWTTCRKEWRESISSKNNFEI